MFPQNNMNIKIFSEVGKATRNTSFQFLEFYVCSCVDFPSSGIDCSQRDPSQCFKCIYPVVYFSGESINDYESSGHLYCRLMGYTAIIIAVLGIITNSLVVVITQRRSGEHSFDFLLRALSHVDTLCCLSCINYCSAHIAYYDNIFGRGKEILCWLYVSSTTFLLWRVVSMYLTLVIIIERYLAITCPLKSRIWFSRGKMKFHICLVFCLVPLVILPAYFRVYIGPNIYGTQEGGLDVPSLREFEYMFLPTRFYNVSKPNDKRVLFAYLFQYWIPVPAMLTLNLLTYKKVKMLSRQRQQLTSSQQRELQPALMFIPVVIVFLCTNVWPLVMSVTLRVRGVTFREVWMSFVLATAVNSSVNFWIYYFRGTAFRTETRALLSRWSTS